MTTVREIYNLLNQHFPFELQDDWDNSGVQICLNPDELITGVGFATDINAKVIDYAIANAYNLIITHHPLFFGKIQPKNLVSGDFYKQTDINSDYAQPTSSAVISALAAKLVKANISLISLHTNLDKALGGVADSCAKAFGLQNTVPIVPELLGCTVQGNVRDNEQNTEQNIGHGRFGKLTNSTNLHDFATYIRKVLQLPQGFVRVSAASSAASLDAIFANGADTDCDCCQTEIKYAAILPGSGESQIPAALKFDPDVIITSDIKHHPLTDFNNQIALLSNKKHIHIIDVPHSTIEQLVFRDGRIPGLIREHIRNTRVIPECLSNPWGFTV